MKNLIFINSRQIVFALIFSICLTAVAAAQKSVQTAAAKTALPAAKTLTKGKIRFTLGKTAQTIDLSKDVSGCLTLRDATDAKMSADATHFQVVDKTAKGGKFYFLLLATAGGNCNVQGQCGAATDDTLIWLELNGKLAVENKKAVVLTSCYYADINTISDTDFGFNQEDGKFTPLKLTKGALEIETEENRNRADEEYKVSKITYKTAAAEKGLIVTTEKRERPKS